jgi:hypothetical protein
LLVENKFQLKITFKTPYLVSHLVPGFVVYNQLNVPVFGSNTRFHKTVINYSSLLEGEMIAEIEELNLHSGNYSISVWLGDQLVDFDEKVEVIQFEYKSKNNYQQLPNPLEIGSVDKVVNWY